jgi:hypothetical protein
MKQKADADFLRKIMIIYDWISYSKNILIDLKFS